MSKNTLFNKYPAIIHGESRVENDEFVVYTRYPRFLARRSFDDTFTGELPGNTIAGEVGQTQNGQLAYNSGIGIWLSDFIFLDSMPKNKTEFVQALQSACDRVTADTVMLDEEVD